jgi:phosphate transport system substrate-binding protein
MKNYRIFAIGALAAILGATTLTGCGTSDPGAGNGGSGSGSTALNIDGSSTVGPIMQAAVEEFSNTNTNVKPTVGISGTGGGFKKFSAGEIDIADASRPIEEKEIEACKAKGIEFIELPIAFDGLSVVVNPKNTFADTLTVAELKKIWEPDSKVKTWADVRAGFPAQEIKLYGAGTDSGTFDYFTKAIVGKEKASRSNYQASEDEAWRAMSSPLATLATRTSPRTRTS